ncbi:MAG: sensor histidine kinase [Odoribacter sp.]
MNTRLNNVLYGILFSGLGVFSYLLLVNYTNLPENVAHVLSSVGASVFFIVAFNILGYTTIHLSEWLNNQYALYTKRRWKITVVYGMVVLMLLLLNYGLLVVAKLIVGATSPFLFPNGGVRILIMVWLVELVILGLLIANKSFQQALLLQQQASDLQEENNKARYAALQNQLNPHFLFNSLNTLIAEIEYDTKNAVVFTKNLSNVYRYVLQCQNKPFISLGEELEFVNAYVFLHKVRLGDCILWDSQIPADYMESMLPPLTLQLLVENIIKHNSITAAKPMKISMAEEQGYLVVTNTVNLKISNESCGVGLKNLSNRYKLTLGKDIVVIEGKDEFTVKVPLLYE